LVESIFFLGLLNNSLLEIPLRLAFIRVQPHHLFLLPPEDSHWESQFVIMSCAGFSKG